MFEFQDLFQWDRFIEPAWTEIREEGECDHFLGEIQGSSLGRRNNGAANA
jgi:hypothetical protein